MTGGTRRVLETRAAGNTKQIHGTTITCKATQKTIFPHWAQGISITDNRLLEGKTLGIGRNV